MSDATGDLLKSLERLNQNLEALVALLARFTQAPDDPRYRPYGARVEKKAPGVQGTP